MDTGLKPWTKLVIVTVLVQQTNASTDIVCKVANVQIRVVTELGCATCFLTCDDWTQLASDLAWFFYFFLGHRNWRCIHIWDFSHPLRRPVAPPHRITRIRAARLADSRSLALSRAHNKSSGARRRSIFSAPLLTNWRFNTRKWEAFNRAPPQPCEAFCFCEGAPHPIRQAGGLEGV